MMSDVYNLVDHLYVLVGEGQQYLGFIFEDYSAVDGSLLKNVLSNVKEVSLKEVQRLLSHANITVRTSDYPPSRETRGLGIETSTPKFRNKESSPSLTEVKLTDSSVATAPSESPNPISPSPSASDSLMSVQQ